MSQKPTGSGADPDAAIRDLAGRQHGVVARTQLIRAGVPVHVIDYRVKKGRLRLLNRGVYRVGPVAGRHEREMAAVLGSGDSAVLSHHTAVSLWELMRYGNNKARVEVSVRHGCRRSTSTVLVHRMAGLRVDETTVLDGLPVTAPARTLLDLAAASRPRDVEQALARADRRKLVTRSRITTLLERHPRYPGTPVLRAVLALGDEPAFCRSEAELQFLTLVRKTTLPRPRTNVVVNGLEVDFLWRSAALVVEIDGFAYHGSSAAFERDRNRDAMLMSTGYRVMRVTWQQLSKEPEEVLVRLTKALVHPNHS